MGGETVSKEIHYCQCGAEIGGEQEICSRCASGQRSSKMISVTDLARRAGRAEANKFIARVERSQRVRVQKLLWEVTDENRALGGKRWKKVLNHFGLKESDIYLEKPLAKNQDEDNVDSQ